MAAGDTISVCAIVKDERPYLIEWIAYYRLLGFDRIILYSNDCSDGSDRLLDAAEQAGAIEHRPWPSQSGLSPQHSAYADAIDRCDTKWILFVDADEFLRLIEDQDVHQFVARFESDVSAVAISWRIFGSGGLERFEPMPVIERFTRAAPRDHPINRHVKTMAIAADISYACAHGVTLARGRYVMPNGVDIQLEQNAFARPRYRIAQINHYVVKSRQEFAAKQRRGIASVPQDQLDESVLRNQSFFDAHDRNEEEFREILNRLGALKAEMRRVRRVLAMIDPQIVSELPIPRLSDRLRFRGRRVAGWWRQRKEQRRARS